MILIYGADGSMGKRYQAILKYLEQPFSTIEIKDDKTVVSERLEACSRVILCTPTDTHYPLLKDIIPVGKPILCEKPITKAMFELADILNRCETNKTDFNMTFQYSEFPEVNLTGPDGQQWVTAEPSSYNYFRTGNDGLVWDCLQIIALAKGEIQLGNDSPIWQCTINGYALDQSQMDGAYVSFVERWLAGKVSQSHNDLYKIHDKTERLANARRS